MNSQQLLYYQTPLSALLLIPFIFYMENFPVYKTYEEQQIAVVASGIVGFVVKSFRSALTYNMIGHMKTISILLGSFTLFDDFPSFKEFIEILLTLSGLFSYTFVRIDEENQLLCTRCNLNPTISTI
ncbi:unnamed protein product [Adineta steineri]|uniref:Sugar phosphate transporter domain-containing protein n=1 Tax=Adineta steineri TaxID=433720 RepID=A0A819DJQ1_9BILA|nr:unnamed protein product [Adineta steineri]CAF3835019.1 unnamed protein product [Adineta steineri]